MTSITATSPSERNQHQQQSNLSLITQDTIPGCFAGTIFGLGKEFFDKNEATAELLLIGATALGAVIILENMNKEEKRVRSVKVIAGLTTALLIFGYTFYTLPSTPLLTTVAGGAIAALAGISRRSHGPFEGRN